MTDEQINRAIAEATGWRSKEQTNDVPWLWMRTKSDCTVETLMEPPDYCSDLNAMHEAEKVLSGTDMYVMGIHIERLVSRHGQHYWHATARQRAEAFLRTLGKWEEVQG